jgi:cytochrome P450
MISLHARHGKLVRTGPNEVSVSDLAAIKKIYSLGTKFRKSDWYSVWQGRRKFYLFVERDEGVHGKQRRLVSGIYSMANISQYQGRVDEAINVFVKEIEKKVNTVMDLGNWLQLFAFGRLKDCNEFGYIPVDI